MSKETLTQTETKKSSKEEDEEEEPLWKKYQRAITEHEEWTVETLVVVDKIMYYKHGKDNITTFTLTLFNMVKHQFYIRSWIYILEVQNVYLSFDLRTGTLLKNYRLCFYLLV